MSTIRRFRKQSNIQFIDTMMELTNHTVFYANRLPKSVKFIWTTKLCDFCQEALLLLNKGNAIHFTNKDEYTKRKLFFEEALGTLNALEQFLTCISLSDYYDYLISKNGNEEEQSDPYPFQKWGELLDKERSLIKAILKADSLKAQVLSK